MPGKTQQKNTFLKGQTGQPFSSELIGLHLESNKCNLFFSVCIVVILAIGHERSYKVYCTRSRSIAEVKLPLDQSVVRWVTTCEAWLLFVFALLLLLPHFGQAPILFMHLSDILILLACCCWSSFYYIPTWTKIIFVHKSKDLASIKARGQRQYNTE